MCLARPPTVIQRFAQITRRAPRTYYTCALKIFCCGSERVINSNERNTTKLLLEDARQFRVYMDNMSRFLFFLSLIHFIAIYCLAKEHQQQQEPGGNDAELQQKKNNILLLLTDDQDVMLGSFDHMPHVKALIQEQGMTFMNGFVHTPICCPSRSSIMTGRYLHNCGVTNNSISGNCYGNDWIENMEGQHTFAIHAKAAGYTTAYTGKYLNMYGYKKSNAVPEGFDHWWGLVGNSQCYNYSLIKGGTDQESERVQYGDQYPQDYLPSVMNQQILKWMSGLPEPWLIVAAWPTPHGPFTPAPWAVGTMSDYHPPLTGNYNASDHFMQQKHWLLRQLHPISESTAVQVDKYYQMRLEALKSIDVHVAEMFGQLHDSNQLDHTVILYTSDNGFQFGQHRLSMDKRHLYENDIRVPFCIRGPGIPPNTESSAIVANIDIAPTILDIVAQATVSSTNYSDGIGMDGISFWKYARGQPDPVFDQRRDLLITYNGEGQNPCGLSECPYPWDGVSWMPDSFNNTYNCVRTLDGDREDSIYCRFVDNEDFVEYYDLQENPYQMNNDVSKLDPIQRQRYEQRLQELLHCHGSSCK